MFLRELAQSYSLLGKMYPNLFLKIAFYVKIKPEALNNPYLFIQNRKPENIVGFYIIKAESSDKWYSLP
jgi:hypothetical protein